MVALSENRWITNEISLKWVKHFNKHSYGRIKGVYYLLVLDGHESHHLIDFKGYYKENNIITLYIPIYLLYLL